MWMINDSRVNKSVPFWFETFAALAVEHGTFTAEQIGKYARIGHIVEVYGGTVKVELAGDVKRRCDWGACARTQSTD